MLINYRNYTAKSMLDILTRECVYYSRGSFVDRGRLRKPDVVTLRAAEGAGRRGCAVVIECEVYSNLEGSEDILRERGFVRDEAAGKYCKRRTIAFHLQMDAGRLVKAVAAGLDEAAQDMPLLTYASPAQKALADYYSFMNSDIARISFNELMQYLGYWEERDFAGKAADEAGDATEYMVARYRKERWAAWAGGDLLVPLFASEAEAVHFLKNRAMRVCRQRPAVRTIPQVNGGCSSNPYILVDRTKNVDERVAWLRGEIIRLERQREVVCS